MKIFDHPNLTNFTCPICGTSEDKPVALIPIVGTNSKESRYTYEARQYHVECIEVWEQDMPGGYDKALVQVYARRRNANAK